MTGYQKRQAKRKQPYVNRMIRKRVKLILNALHKDMFKTF